MSTKAVLPPAAQKLLLAGFGMLVICASLIPVSPGSEWAAPDLLYCLVVAWILRRPAIVPIWLVVILGLLADVMLSRPIGLGALGLMLAAEFMRSKAPAFHAAPFVLEWLVASIGFALVLAGIHLMMHLAFLDAPGLAASMRYLVSTALAYPVVAAGLVWGLGLRAPSGTRAAHLRMGRLP